MSIYDEFIKAVEDYYGDYRPAVKGLLIEYLKKHIKPEKLKGLFSLLTREFSGQYNKPPDIAIMNKYLSDDNYNRYFPANRIKKIEDNTQKVEINEVDKLFEKIHNKFKDKS